MKIAATSKKTKLFYILLLLSLITIGTHAYLSDVHYSLKLGLASGKSLCNVSQTFNCDSVAASKYAQFAGIPMAVLGIFTQIAILVLLLAAHFELSTQTSFLKRFLVKLTGFTAAISMIMGSISMFLLGTYCLFCMVAYLLSFLSFFFMFKYQRLENETSNKNYLIDDAVTLATSARWVFVLTLMIPAASYVSDKSILSSYGYNNMDNILLETIANWNLNPAYEFKTDSTLSTGPADAKMTIVEFADYLCPHCRMAYPALNAFTKSHKDVRLIFKNFPLDAKCNKGLTHEGDGFRCKLSAAVHCAEKISQKGWDLHHWIFDNQESLGSPDKFSELLKTSSASIGFSAEEVEKCTNEDSTLEAIQATGQEGVLAKIQGTPTVFVNGKLLDRGQFLPVLEAVYKKIHE